MTNWFKRLFSGDSSLPPIEGDKKSVDSKNDELPFRIVAVHKVEISHDDLRKKMRTEPNWTSLTEDYLLELVARLYIFDLYFSDIGFAAATISEITQNNGMDQVPFHELYFDETGENQLFADQPNFPEPPADAHYPARLKFFLHYVDIDVPLTVGSRNLPLPETSKLPEKLREVMPYNPPN